MIPLQRLVSLVALFLACAAPALAEDSFDASVAPGETPIPVVLPRLEQRAWKPPPATATPAPIPVPICRVTELADGGTGTLRWCVDQDGPIRVVFRVSGTIRHRAIVNVGSDKQISGAGQRVVLKGYGLMVRGARRVRISDLTMRDCDADCITVTRSTDVLLEGIDATNSGDGLIDIIRVPAGGGHVTVRNSRLHHHAKCMLIGHQDVSTDRLLTVLLDGMHFEGCHDRMPTVQWATVIVQNTTIEGWRQEGIEARHQGWVILENVNWIQGPKSHARWSAYSGGHVIESEVPQ